MNLLSLPYVEMQLYDLRPSDSLESEIPGPEEIDEVFNIPHNERNTS